MITLEEKKTKVVTGKIPVAIFEFVNKYFEGALLSKIERNKDKNGSLIFEIDACIDDTLNHLKFNSQGALLSSETEPLLEYYDDEYETL